MKLKQKIYSIGLSEDLDRRLRNELEKIKWEVRMSQFIRILMNRGFNDLLNEQLTPTSMLRFIYSSPVMRQDGATEETTWTGYYRGIKRVGNTIYPAWSNAT
jgi:hypothetical protein